MQQIDRSWVEIDNNFIHFGSNNTNDNPKLSNPPLKITIMINNADDIANDEATLIFLQNLASRRSENTKLHIFLFSSEN